MSNCLVSIVTISRNHSQGLQKTLDSVKQQDYQEIEHIIIDGDSDDGSKELLSSYSHSKMYTYFSEPDTGISNAFNKGLDRSNGDLILFLNAGDILSTDQIISAVVASYLEHQWKFAVGAVTTSDRAGKEAIYNPPKLSSKFLKFFMFLPHQGVFCKLSLHQKYRFNESIKTSMDYDMCLQMHPLEIFYLPILVAKLEPGGVSSDTHRRIVEQTQIRINYAVSTQEKILIHVVNALILLKSYLRIDSPFASKKYKS